jgi:hypothetical protein
MKRAAQSCVTHLARPPQRLSKWWAVTVLRVGLWRYWRVRVLGFLSPEQQGMPLPLSLEAGSATASNASSCTVPTRAIAHFLSQPAATSTSLRLRAAVVFVALGFDGIFRRDAGLFAGAFADVPGLDAVCEESSNRGSKKNPPPISNTFMQRKKKAKENFPRLIFADSGRGPSYTPSALSSFDSSVRVTPLLAICPRSTFLASKQYGSIVIFITPRLIEVARPVLLGSLQLLMH